MEEQKVHIDEKEPNWCDTVECDKVDSFNINPMPSFFMHQAISSYVLKLLIIGKVLYKGIVTRAKKTIKYAS